MVCYNLHLSMAISMYSYSLLLMVTVLILLTIKPINSTSSSKHHHHHGLRSLHFSLFQHETVNGTGFFIVNGVKGPGITQTTMPFGTIYVFNDPMTTTPNPSSKVVGFAEGNSITSSFDGLRSVSVAKITLNIKQHKGSLSIVGGTHNTKPSDHPVVGGTGDFLFVQGYVTSSPVDLKGLTVVFKIEFHLYWPPYAIKA